MNLTSAWQASSGTLASMGPASAPARKAPSSWEHAGGAVMRSRFRSACCKGFGSERDDRPPIEYYIHTNVNTHKYLDIHTYVCMYVCMHVCTCVYVFVYRYAYWTYVYIYICICVCVCAENVLAKLLVVLPKHDTAPCLSINCNSDLADASSSNFRCCCPLQNLV